MYGGSHDKETARRWVVKRKRSGPQKELKVDDFVEVGDAAGFSFQ